MTNEKVVSSIGNGYDNSSDRYEYLLESIPETFKLRVKKDSVLFKVEVDDLFNVFLENLPEEARQHYKCNSCRQFVNRYGSLVTINQDGTLQSVIWDENTPSGIFTNSIKAMKELVEGGVVHHMFLTELKVLGTPKTGEWRHMAIRIPDNCHFKVSRIKKVGEVIAERIEDFKCLFNSVMEYEVAHVNEGVRLLTSGHLDRGYELKSQMEWFADICTKFHNTKNHKLQSNILWLAVGNAPDGWTHIKSGMLGTLLDDIKDGLLFEDIKGRFDDKMDPTKRLRPQAPATTGNIKQAEIVIASLGLESALRRRYATIEEIKPRLLWEPKVTEETTNKTGGVFGELLDKANKKEEPDELSIPTTTMTWVKFMDKVLPEADEISIFCGLSESFGALVTAVDPEAPPILQWDKEGDRNPVSWYVYSQPTSSMNWNVKTRQYNKLSGITYQPPMWTSTLEKHGRALFFIIEGAKDNNYQNVGLGLFPENLISELHPIRATIEQYSNMKRIEGFEESSACGIKAEENIQNWNVILKVKGKKGTNTYKIDRWD